MKSVYVPMSADIIHPGHIRLLKRASSYGVVTVSLATDAAILAKKGKVPIMSFGERQEVLSAVKYVDTILCRDAVEYFTDLYALKPDYFVHGDDWSAELAERVRSALAEWGGELIVTSYYSPVSSSIIKQRVIRHVEG